MFELQRVTRSRRERGSVLPAVLALSVGVAALAGAFVSQNHREHERERFERDRMQSYLDAWAQMEIASEIVNASPYDGGTGENAALRDAAARDDREFIDRDGHTTGVRCESDGGPGAGFFRLVSTAEVGGTQCRITALVRSRQSFADFDYFVNSHSLGIAGGADASTRHADAPDGDIHSNRQLLFYFPDRHFVKPVTASEGFQYVSGAVGQDDPDGADQNTWFWGASNPSANQITGLTDVDIPALGTRGDTVLSLDGPYDWAKIKLRGTTARVEHWTYGHNEVQDVPTQVERFHYETQQQEVLQKIANTTTWEAPVYTTTQVWVYGPVAQQVLIAEAWDETVTRTRREARQRWVDGGGGGATGGGGTGDGSVGYWETYYVDVTYDEIIHHPAEYKTVYVDDWHFENQTVQTGTQTKTSTTYTYAPYSPPQYKNVQVKVTDGWDTVLVQQTVWVSQTKVETLEVPATGTIFVQGKVEFPAMSKSSDGYAVQTLDGNLTIGSGDNINIQESIVYAHPDDMGKSQTAFLNGSDRTQEYVPNPSYGGASVLGLIARNDVEIQSAVPDQAEINATIMATEGEVRVKGVNVASDGTVSVTSSGKFVKTSLRRLGGIISNQRPVTTYVDGSNAVTRGFIYTKSVYDTRQRTNPPRGFPSLNRPRVMATFVREIN